MNEKVNLKNCSVAEIECLLINIDEKKFRAKQIFEWVHKGINDFESMSNLSKELIIKLSQHFYINSGKIEKRFESRIDGTIKYLIRLHDGEIIETVIMKYNHGISICISTQVGCRMGCKFCASTQNGLVRNLESGEILEQILIATKDIGQRISNIVIMGIGEPLDNYDNVIKFLNLVNSKDGLNIGYRHITISTCGIVPNIIKLSSEGMPITLAVSLHASNDETRKETMPISNKYSIFEILGACRTYIKNTNRRITFEYAMISNVNDTQIHAKELSELLKGLLCHVNLIPVNGIEENCLVRSSNKVIKNFQNILSSKGIETTIRRELGNDINASCGQLRNSHIKK